MFLCFVDSHKIQNPKVVEIVERESMVTVSQDAFISFNGKYYEQIDCVSVKNIFSETQLTILMLNELLLL